MSIDKQKLKEAIKKIVKEGLPSIPSLSTPSGAPTVNPKNPPSLEVDDGLKAGAKYPLEEDPSAEYAAGHKDLHADLGKSVGLSESGFSRVRGMMMGLVPSINTIGIMTAENPNAAPTPSKQNKALNKSLMSKLREMNYGPIQIGGSFGQKENSFLIPNISRDELAALGKEFGQEAVIWAAKQNTSEGPGMHWEYLEGDNTVQTRDVSMGGTKVQDKEDYYSEKDGRKFVIPFFDDEYEAAKPSKGGREIEKKVPPLQEEVDDLKDRRATALHESIKRRAKQCLDQSRTHRSRWHHRGVMKIELKELLRLLGEKGK